MKLPSITVITPSFNQGRFIERTIQSVLSQNYPKLQFIVMDGGSTDTTCLILKKYTQQLTWYSEPDAGQADAINKGLRISTGQVLAYLNSDDTYNPGALLEVGRYFATHPQTHFIYSHGLLIDLKDKVIGGYNDSLMDLERLWAQCGISQPTAFWTREVYRKVGEFDATYRYTMDYDYWVRVAKVFPLQFLPNYSWANTRIHPASKTASQTSMLHQDALRVQLSHYGKVHHDWINTLADGEVSHLRNGNPIQRRQYWLYLFRRTLYLHWKLNHALPPNIQQRQYYRWLQEIKAQWRHA